MHTISDKSVKKASKQLKWEIFMVEYSLGKYDPSSKQAHELAHKMLKIWARGTPHGDIKEIYALTGNAKHSPLGKQVKRSNKDKNIYGDVPMDYDNSEHERLNGIINRMSPFNKLFIDYHYVSRPKHGINMAKALEEMKTTKHQYYIMQNKARQEFIRLGGI